MNSHLILSRLTDRRAGLSLTAVVAACLGVALTELCWQLSSLLFYYGIIPTKNPFMLLEGMVRGAIFWQFLLGFSLTRFLWHRRQIEWWMFALIMTPIPIYFVRSLPGVSTEVLLLLCGVAMCWAAIAGRTRFQKIDWHSLSGFWDEYRGRIGWIMLCSIISTACFLLAWWIKRSIADQSCREPGWSFDCFSHTLMWIVPVLIGLYMVLGILLTKFISDCEDR